MACKTIDNVHSTLLEKGLIDSKFNIIGNTEDVFPYIDSLNQYGKEKYGVKEDLISTRTIPARLGRSATVKVFYNQEVGQQIDKIKDSPDLYSSKINTEDEYLNSGATKEDFFEDLQDKFGNEEIPLGDNYGEFLKYKLEVLSKKEHEISLLRAKLSSATPSFKVKLLKEIGKIEKDINFIQEQVSKLEKYEVEYMFHAIKEDLDQIEQIFKSKDNSNYLEIKKKLEFYDTFLVGKNSEYSAESLQDYVELTDEFNALVVKAKMLSDKYPEYMASTTVEQLQEQELVQETMENSGKSINELITSTQDITSFDSYLMGLSNTAFSSDNILPQYLQIQMHKALINHTNVSSKLIDILNQVEKETGLYNPDWIYNKDKNGNKDNTIIDSYTDTWFNATKTFRTLIYQYKVSNVKNKHAAHLAVTQWLKDNTFMIDFSKIPKIREIYRNNPKYSKYFDSNFTDEQAETWENEMRKQYGFRYDELIENLILSLERFENISNDTTYSEVYKNRYNVWEVLQNIKNGVRDYHHIKLGDNKISFYSDFYSLPFLPKEANERRQITNKLGQRVPPPDFYNQDFRNTVLNNADNTKYYDAVRNIVKYNNDTYSTNIYTNGRYSFPRVRKEMLQSLGDSLKEIRGGNFKELYSVGKEVLNNWQAMFYEKGFSYETEGKVNSNYRDTYKKEVKEREQGYIIQGLSKEDAYKKAIIETDKNYSEDFSRDIKAISQMASLHNARVEMAPMAESVVEAYKHFNPEMKNGLGRLEYYVNHIIYNRTGKYRNSGKWEGEKINPKIQHFLDIINGVSKGKLAKYKGKLLSDSEKELFSMYKDVIEKGIIPKEISINERIGDSHFKLSKTEKLHTIQGKVATEEEWNKEFEKFIKAKVEDMGLDLNVAGLVDGILKTVIYKALAINPISGIFNRNEGLNSAYIMDATGLYWTPNNLQSAKEMMAFYNSRKIWSKYKKNAPIRKGAKQMSIFEQLIKRMPSVLQDRKDELQRNANENKFSLEDMDIFWLAVQSAESKNQGSIMLSMMMDYKLKDSNGNEVPMIDKHTKEFTAFDLDSKGHIVAKPGFEQYLDNITNFEDLIINMSVAISRSQGNYSQNDIMRAKGAIWGKVLTNMITWLPEHLAQRWGTSKQIDLYRKGEITQGRYVAAAQGNTINTGFMVGLGGLGISYGMLGMAGLIGGGIISAVVATKYLAKIASTNTVKRDANYIKEFTQMLLSLGIEYLNYPSHLLSSIPGMRKLKFFKNANPLSNNTMTEAQQNSMRAMTRELAIMLFWLSVKMAIMALYKGIGGDDDDEKSDRRMRYYFLQNQLSRSITTLESFMNPYAFVKDNARNIFLSELTDIFKLAHSVLTFDWEGIKDNSTAPIPIPSMVDKTVRNLIGNRENSIIQDKIDYSSMVDFEKIPSPLHWTSTLTKDFFTDGEYSNKKEYRDAREKVREKIKEEVMEEYGEDKDLVKTITDLRVKELIGNKYEDLSYEDATESIESGEIMKDPKIKKKSTKQSRLKSLEESLEEQGITPTEVRKIVSKESNR